LSLTEKQKQIIVDIDKRANKILKNGGGDEELLMGRIPIL